LKRRWSDAWILLAVIYASREKPARLVDVIAAADFIQHAIVTYREMQGALGRLTAGGYITEDNGMLGQTAKTTRFYQTLREQRSNVRKDEQAVAEFIESTAWLPGDDPHAMEIVAADYHGLSEADFNAAVDAYLSRFPRLTGVKRKDKNH